jgi:hypothetical protein
MKKVLLLVPFLVLASVAAGAGPISVGATVGMPLTWAYGEDWDDSLDMLDDGSNTLSPGIVVGAFGSYDITDAITVQVNALVALYVWGMEGEFTGNDTTVSSQLFLAEFPVLAKYKIPLWKGAVSLFAGPDIFYGIGRIDTRTEQEGSPDSDTGGELERRWVFGATGGAGYELPLGPGALSLDVRYTRLFTTLEAEDVDPPNLQYEYYIQAVSLYLSYAYQLGR